MRIFSLCLLTALLAESCQAFVSRRVAQTHHRVRSAPLRTGSHLRAAAANEGTVTVYRGQEECQLAYRIVRPMSLSSRQAAPIVVLHGGPSVPSNYLYPLEQHVPYRSIVFYDQIGCGRSSEPTDPSLYSIDAAVDDLEALLKKIGVRRFHLYGQSFGGILAFEYVKRLAERAESDDSSNSVECLSVILSSTPTCVTLVEEQVNRLVAALDDTSDETISVAERFRLEHQCRTPEMPAQLADAHAHAGTVWRGTTAIADYEATAPSETARRMQSCMVLRGEHDFVTEPCLEGWKTCFNHKSVRYKTLKACSHHGLLENGLLYGDLVDSFCGEYD